LAVFWLEKKGFAETKKAAPGGFILPVQNTYAAGA
tara:strand:+ start:745 stop:849 length:105 start_codon:yes stop_codon:yes gene_type:complete